jgi:hypothetical protein
MRSRLVTAVADAISACSSRTENLPHQAPTPEFDACQLGDTASPIVEEGIDAAPVLTESHVVRALELRWTPVTQQRITAPDTGASSLTDASLKEVLAVDNCFIVHRGCGLTEVVTLPALAGSRRWYEGCGSPPPWPPGGTATWGQLSASSRD